MAVEAENAREDIGLPLKDTRVVDEITARKIVRRVNNHIVFPDYFHSVARVKPDRVRDHADLRIDEAKLLFGSVGFSLSQIRFREDELPLKVRQLDQIGVGDPDPAYTSGHEIDSGWDSEASEAYN